MAGGGGSDLRPGEEKLSSTQADPRDTRDAPGHRGCAHSRLTEIRFLWSVKHRLYRAGESDSASRRGSAGTSHLGHSAAVPTPARPSGVVARLLSLCSSACIPTSGLRPAARARGQTSGATLPPADSSHGSRQNHPTMDSRGSPLFSSAAGLLLSLLRAPEARRGSRNGRDGSVKLRADGGGERLDETASLDGRMKGKPARNTFARVGRIIHHVLWQYPYASHGSGKNQPKMDGAFGALLPNAKGFRLRGIEARCACSIMSRGGC